MRAVTDRLPHALRSDARDNRELILDAARTVFAAEGLNVPITYSVGFQLTGDVQALPIIRLCIWALMRRP